MWLRRLPWWRGSRTADGKRTNGIRPEPRTDSTAPARSGSMTGGITAALRAGRVADARRRLSRWRARYLAARRRAVQVALSRLEASDLGDAEQEDLKNLLADTESAAATESLVRRAHGGALPLQAMASFRECLAVRARRNQLAGSAPEWLLNSKARGYKFVATLGVSYPEIVQENVRVSAIEQRTGVAVKPTSAAGSRGVYLVLGDGRVFEPRCGEWLSDWSAMLASMDDVMSGPRPVRDRWAVEALVTEDAAGTRPGRDLKFYCFYGRVGLVLEIDRWAGDSYCEWDRDGNAVFSGKYDGKRFDGEGVTPSQIELAERIGAEIPAPFIRIDFLRSATAAEGMMFCEFTPRPGNFHRFGADVDRQLGEAFLDADARLARDLLAGKRFPKLFRRAARRASKEPS